MDAGEDLNPSAYGDYVDGGPRMPSLSVYDAKAPCSEQVIPVTPDIKLRQYAAAPDLKLDFLNPSDADFRYSNAYPKRGICLIVNNDKFDRSVNMPDRVGSQADISNIYKAFHFLDFYCLLVQNVSMRQLRRVMNDMANRDHSQSDCFACVLLSHGEEGQIYATDGLVRIDDLLAPFKGDVCASLAGKPKLFFIQACRGNRLDSGTTITNIDPDNETDSGEAQNEKTQRIPAEADFLLACSVVSGYYSWRNSRSGSWFIQAITSVFFEHGRTMDLLRMMTRVNRKVAYEFESNASNPAMSKKKQTPSLVSMLTKELYFPPKKTSTSSVS